jgi:Transposase IS66 family
VTFPDGAFEHYAITNGVLFFKDLRFVAHLLNKRDAQFVFLEHTGVEATNHLAERAIRPAVINRKTSGRNRTQRGHVYRPCSGAFFAPASSDASKHLKSAPACSMTPSLAFTKSPGKQIQWILRWVSWL